MQHAGAHAFIVVNHQYAHVEHLGPAWIHRGRRLHQGLGGQWQGQAEHAATPGRRLQRQRMPECACQSIDNGQAQTEPLAAIPLGVAELVKFAKHLALLRRFNAESGVPDLQHRMITPPAASHQQATPVGVANRVGDQVAQHQFNQSHIGANPQIGFARAVSQALGVGLPLELPLDLVEQGLQLKWQHVRLDHARLYARKVE